MVYRLIDEYNRPIFEFRGKYDDYSLSGQLYWIVGWDMNYTPMDYEFVADMSIKWDGCSHWYFNGMDYSEDNKEIDGYYHICGEECYIEFMQGIMFVYELAKKSIGKFDNFKSYKRKINLLEGCKIIKVEEE